MNYNLPGAAYPGKLQAIAIIQTVVGSLQIIGGIVGGLWVLLMGIATFGIGLLFIPIPLVFLAVGILSLVSGVKGLNRNPGYGLTLGVAIAQMALILMCDVFSFGSGLAALILILQDDVKGYFR
jgi:hypothetical protein